MTIQTINIGTTPNDNTGDDPRTAGQKLNSNFTTSTHAASRDVGTASGNVMEVGAGGLLGNAIRWATNDLNDINKTGFYDADGGDTNLPSGVGGTIIHIENSAENSATQYFATFDNSGHFTRTKTTGVGWGPWQELYHSGNLNPNVFGGVAGATLEGKAVSATVALFQFQTASPSVPASVVVSGVFNILNSALSTITTSVSVTLSSRSSKGVAVYSVSGLSGLTAGDTVYLSCDSASSLLEVNF